MLLAHQRFQHDLLVVFSSPSPYMSKRSLYIYIIDIYIIGCSDLAVCAKLMPLLEERVGWCRSMVEVGAPRWIVTSANCWRSS